MVAEYGWRWTCVLYSECGMGAAASVEWLLKCGLPSVVDAKAIKNTKMVYADTMYRPYSTKSQYGPSSPQPVYGQNHHTVNTGQRNRTRQTEK